MRIATPSSLLVVLAVLAGAAGADGQPARLDSRFSDDGKLRTGFVGSLQRDTAFDVDEKIRSYVLGISGLRGGLIRLRANGPLARSFGRQGIGEDRRFNQLSVAQ